MVSSLIIVVPVLCVLSVVSVVSPFWCGRLSSVGGGGGGGGGGGCGLFSVLSSVLLFPVSSFRCSCSLSVQWSISRSLWCPWGNIYRVVGV